MLLKLTMFLLCGVFSGSAADSLVRSFDRTVTLTNLPIVVTADFTNRGPAMLRGFFYADQIPSAFDVTPLRVTLNGQSITNYRFEAGLDGDVYPGCTPYRWVLERPRNFAETNPIPPQANMQIVYAISSETPGSHVLQQFGWVGYDGATTNGIFGVSEPADEQSVRFLTPSVPDPVLTITNDKANLTFATESDVTYIVEYKDDLNAANWITLTNVEGAGNMVVWEDPSPLLACRFYRVRLP